MCLIITILFLVMAVQSFMNSDYASGSLYLIIALGFAFMLWRNIQLTRCERNGNCSGCTLPNWMTKRFKKTNQQNKTTTSHPELDSESHKDSRSESGMTKE